MTLPDGSFPDYGDRDDGFAFRIHGNYDESPFPGLLSIGAFFLNRPEWYKRNSAIKRMSIILDKQIRTKDRGC